MNTGDLLDRAAISTRVSAANKKKVLAVIAEIAARNFHLDAGDVLDALSEPVDLLFALFAPKNAGAEHLRALARVSRIMRQSELREQLRKARTADAVHALLVQDAARPAA